MVLVCSSMVPHPEAGEEPFIFFLGLGTFSLLQSVLFQEPSLGVPQGRSPEASSVQDLAPRAAGQPGWEDTQSRGQSSPHLERRPS